MVANLPCCIRVARLSNDPGAMYFGLGAEPFLTFVSLNSSNRKRRVASVRLALATFALRGTAQLQQQSGFKGDNPG
jgi:hypothetical protein